MIANYHTHTLRCNHATGTEEEYILKAIERGIKILGFSDHTPYFFEGDHYSYFRMRPHLLDDYVDTINALKEKYKDKIEIHLGVEVEYYPTPFNRLLELLRSKGIEYMILGQHFVGDEVNEPYCGRENDSDENLARYVSQTIEGMKTGLFTYLAHPDLLWYTGADETYTREMSRLCAAAKELDMPLEINLLGLATGRNYPNEKFWRIAAKYGCKAILGCDAHSPQEMANTEIAKKGRKFAEDLGLNLIDTVELKRI